MRTRLRFALERGDGTGHGVERERRTARTHARSRRRVDEVNNQIYDVLFIGAVPRKMCRRPQ